MTLYRMFDASIPPTAIPPGAQVAMGYVGKPGFTPHVWTLQEWLRFQHLPQIPVYVPDLSQPPAAEADAAYQAVTKLGWAPGQPLNRAIVFDFETAQGPAIRGWWKECADTVAADGFTGVMYGSLSTVLENAASDVIVAAWDNVANLLPGQTIHGHQFQNDVPAAGPTQIDWSMIDAWLYQRAGVGPRHA